MRLRREHMLGANWLKELMRLCREDAAPQKEAKDPKDPNNTYA